MATDLQKLIIAQESGGDNNAYNSGAKATGSMQITPAFVADVNRLGGRNYTLADMKDPEKARDAQRVWSDYYYRSAEKEKGSALTDKEKLMMHHGGPNGWKRPNSGYWVERKSGRVWMSNARYADEAMMKGTGFVDTEDSAYRYGMSATPRPADIPKPPAAFDWNNPVDSAFAMIDAFGETWEAAARQNPTIAAVSAMKNGSFDYRKDADYNVFDDLEGYEGYAKSFINVESRHDAELIKQRIDQELNDREVIARSGAAGVVAGIATGILDPINFIPIGGAAVTTGKVGANILRSAGKVALAGAVAGTANEIIMQGLEETRTVEESAFNIAGATVLSGLLGAAVGALAGKQVDNLAAAIEKDMDVEPPKVAASEAAAIYQESEAVSDIVQQVMAASETVTKEQADAVGVIIHGVSKYLGVTPEEFVNARIAGIVADDTIAGTATSAAKTVKASVEFLDDGKAVIRAVKTANVADFTHEIGHIFRRTLGDADLKAAEKWAGVENGNWTVAAEEKFARGFERYLADGKAPNKKIKAVYKKFKEWMTNIYGAIKGSDIDVELSPEMRQVFDKVVAGTEESSAPPITQTAESVDVLNAERNKKYEIIYRGELHGDKPGKFWSTDKEFALNFTQSGQENEIKKAVIFFDDIYDTGESRAFAGNENEVNDAIKKAILLRKKAVRLSEGKNQPPSVFIIDKNAIKNIETFNNEAPNILRAERPELPKTRRIALQDKLADELAKKEGLVSAFGVEKVMQFQDPVLRMQNSPSGKAREIVNKLAESFTWKQKNVAGEASAIPVSNAIRAYRRNLVDAIMAADEQFAKYRGFDTQSFSRIKAFGEDKLKQTGKLTHKQFREEVGKAMRNNDSHNIPEVAEAAKAYRKTLIDPVSKMAQELGLLPEHLEVKTAESYLFRMWNMDRITAKRDEFVNGVVIPHLKRMQGEDESLQAMTSDQVKYFAGQITDRILGTPAGRLPYDVGDSSMFPKLDVPGLRGPLKPRVFDIEDNLVQDWLVKDVERVGRAYVRNMAADIELTRSFGSVDLLQEIDAIRADYAEMALSPNLTEKDRTLLARIGKQNEQDLLDMRDMLRGTFRRDDWASPMGRAMRNIKTLNFLRLLGGMTLSAIPDMGSVVFYHGLGNVFGDAVTPMMKNMKAFKAAAGEVKDAATALDLVIGDRIQSIGDLDYTVSAGDNVTTGLNNAADAMSIVSLMSPWNTGLKQFTGVVSQSEIIKAAQRLVDGTASADEVTRLAANYIDKAAAEKIVAQVAEHSEKYDGLIVPNARQWTDADAQKVFRAAVRREVDGVIVTPDLDRPTFLSTPILGTVGQFKSFAFASTQRVLISGLQRHDMATLQGTMMMTGLGMMAYAFKTMDAGRELSDDPKVWIQEGVDRSGIVSILMEVNNTAEKITRGRVGLSAMTGQQGTRYYSRGVADVLLGPSAGMLTDAAKVAGDAAGMEWSENDTRAARRLLPYQNLILFRRLLDKAEEGVNEAIGANGNN
ncbi:MAG: hypothetical protein HGA87_01455 [Desulfobulbaceae bacterium]|nr:hypothetical protein [Desulfobulbaceae bacterium]